MGQKLIHHRGPPIKSLLLFFLIAYKTAGREGASRLCQHMALEHADLEGEMGQIVDHGNMKEIIVTFGRASKSWGREEVRLRNFFDNLRKLCTFERKTGKTRTLFYDFGTIWQYSSTFYGILRPFLCAKFGCAKEYTFRRSDFWNPRVCLILVLQ